MTQLIIIATALVQVASFFFSRAVAKHDAAAVNVFVEYEYPNKEHEKEDQENFHSSNFMLKFWFGFCIGILSIVFLEWYKALALGISVGLIVWAVFDPTLNVLRRHKKAWDYLSDSNKTDRFLFKVFGQKNAGKAKAYIVVGVIALLNVILYAL